MTVAVQPHRNPEVRGDLLAQVKVNDLRAPGVAASKREAAFGTPMGNITFQPREAELVKSLLEVELTRLMQEKGISARQDFVCEIQEFGVNTITTPVYWDVVGRIRLVMKKDGKEYDLAGTATERTFVWPGEELVRKVIQASLSDIVPQLRQVSLR